MALLDDAECAGKGPENVHAAQSTAVLDEISRNDLDDHRGREKDTDDCRSIQRDFTEVGVKVEAVSGGAAQQDGVAAREKGERKKRM
ncbi:hypothetical protein MRX96_014675 [Rhipicephalus microplus]